jgi:hypothetical protein
MTSRTLPHRIQRYCLGSRYRHLLDTAIFRRSTNKRTVAYWEGKLSSGMTWNGRATDGLLIIIEVRSHCVKAGLIWGTLTPRRLSPSRQEVAAERGRLPLISLASHSPSFDHRGRSVLPFTAIHSASFSTPKASPAQTASYGGGTTLRGHVKRGTGFLNNELYVGRPVWNRQRYI